ncbi:MAG: hypothetical protein HC881_16265 [Leptolyngbyaceae cyanobacterium SL_7_1]|nr:hypothetical protein [Leptolyngbyaceae cyanobacterium SL_7_1]
MALSDEEIYLQILIHENDLMNHRITWFITLQGLLFAALGFAWDKQDAQKLILILSILGTLTSISSGFVLWGGASAIDELLKKTTIGRRAKKIERFFYPWYTFPLLFLAAWIVILSAK